GLSLGRWRSWRQAGVSVALVLLGAVAVGLVRETKPVTGTSVLVLGAVALGLSAGLALLLALFSKLHVGRYQYPRLLLIASVTTAVLLADYSLSSSFYFNLEIITFSMVAEIVSYLQFLVLFYLFFSSLGRAVLPEIPKRTRRRWVAGSGLLLA